MPIRKTDNGWMWGSKGPFPTKSQALAVARAAYAHGYKEDEQMNGTAEFIGTLLHSATVAHFKHLQAQGPGSYAAHVALGTYYEEIVDLVDSLAESIQGLENEIIGPYAPMFANNDDEPLVYMTKLQEFVRTKRESLPQDSEIQNEIDAIATLINSTCYKLARLK